MILGRILFQGAKALEQAYLNIVIDIFELGPPQIYVALRTIELQFVSYSASDDWFDLFGVKARERRCFLERVICGQKRQKRGINL